MLNSTTAAFKGAHRAGVTVHVHCESLGYVSWFFETMHAVHCWNPSYSALIALLFLILMTSSRLKELLQTCCRLYCFELLFGGVSGVCGERAQQIRTREGKKDLNLGFICRPQTRYIKYISTKVWIVLLSALLARNLHSFILLYKHFKRKINWQMKLTSNVSSGAGRIRRQHARARWKSRRLLAMISLSFGVGEPTALRVYCSSSRK